MKVSALCPGPTRTEFGAVAGIQSLGQFDRLSMEAGPVVRAGLDGLEKNRAVVDSRSDEQDRRMVHALRSALVRAEDRRLAEVLTGFSSPAPAPH